MTETSLSSKQKGAAKILSGNETSAYDDVCDVKTFYRRIYFNVTDMVINCIENQFTQAGYQPSRNIEQLLLNVFRQLRDVVGVYSDEVNHYRLSSQLQLLVAKFIESDEIAIPGIINYMKQCPDVERLFSEIIMLLRPYLVSPATYAVSERSASTKRRIKTGYAAR